MGRGRTRCNEAVALEIKNRFQVLFLGGELIQGELSKDIGVVVHTERKYVYCYESGRRGPIHAIHRSSVFGLTYK